MTDRMTEEQALLEAFSEDAAAIEDQWREITDLWRELDIVNLLASHTSLPRRYLLDRLISLMAAMDDRVEAFALRAEFEDDISAALEGLEAWKDVVN
jgi:hypothetical protein